MIIILIKSSILKGEVFIFLVEICFDIYVKGGVGGEEKGLWPHFYTYFYNKHTWLKENVIRVEIFINAMQLTYVNQWIYEIIDKPWKLWIQYEHDEVYMRYERKDEKPNQYLINNYVKIRRLTNWFIPRIMLDCIS